MDQLNNLLEEPKQFAKECIQLLHKCTKPDEKEFLKITQAVAIGFLLMGFIGYFVKLVHIPINNIIVGGA
ncbi:Protein transport protein Sec61 subunit gamma [Basidiobolus ranarum]|uniref:Protein transport protein Sec61 subunit gamma n=1 Tax=Basidiobolus ranarum TaxID=34480 RepID=A0ABR2W5L7_9FUNG